MHDFFAAPGWFLFGMLMAIVGLIYGLAMLAFWIFVGGIVIFALVKIGLWALGVALGIAT